MKLFWNYDAVAAHLLVEQVNNGSIPFSSMFRFHFTLRNEIVEEWNDILSHYWVVAKWKGSRI